MEKFGWRKYCPTSVIKTLTNSAPHLDKTFPLHLVTLLCSDICGIFVIIVLIFMPCSIPKQLNFNLYNPAPSRIALVFHVRSAYQNTA